jgi:hypothetical protein
MQSVTTATYANRRKDQRRNSAVRRLRRPDSPRSRLRSYSGNHERIARQSFSVADWKRRRFDSLYPNHEVDVLLANGKPASPRMTLSKIRASYES